MSYNDGMILEKFFADGKKAHHDFKVVKANVNGIIICPFGDFGEGVQTLNRHWFLPFDYIGYCGLKIK